MKPLSETMRGLIDRVLGWLHWATPTPVIKPKRKYKHRVKHDKDPNDNDCTFDPANWKLANLRKEITRAVDDLTFRDDTDANASFLPRYTIKALRNIGPYMCSPGAWFRHDKVEFIGVHNFPSIAFIGFHIGQGQDADSDVPRFLFAVKANKRTLPMVEAAPGCVVYECGIGQPVDEAYMRGDRVEADAEAPTHANSHIYWGRWFAAVNKKTGAVKSLRVKHHDVESIQSKKPRNRNGGASSGWNTVHHQHWRPMWVDEEHSAEQCAGSLAICLNAWMTREWHWNIVCKSRKHRVTFSVAQNDAVRFFRDREIDIGGRRKPIFHMVKAHYRTKADGSQTTVKGHHRGKQRFTWDGYRISIIAPGLKAPSLTSMDMEGSHFDEDAPIPKGLIPLEEATQQIAEKYE